ncbi:Na+/H+ antiporter subunit B [Cecembia lonarensis]|uniref:Multiple resistance and pH homeostasis protein B n=1 Tax=Cecembia lonarensis (strain CCUG 58316 / KCTC 22772 / LW9) TaxID=1225176 RepID=K1KZD1_CECL9|nr:Na+/H+ antiporter subunit B [Cecembia lonarensis]EKB47856.1 Multiple resistance and pH homeostasis protein B [Cecembia lonarensis LW9]
MKSIIFKTSAKYLLPVLMLFSVFMLLRGHYLPGGGFVGGLMAALAFILHSFAFGLEETKKMIVVHPGLLMPIGLFFALMAGIAPWVFQEPFMTGLWYGEPLRMVGMVGTALLFDIGVYFVVIGSVLTVMFSIREII